ncbi:MAG: hypothetical protein V3T88_08645 [Nitrosomonadaceae bacterium]
MLIICDDYLYIRRLNDRTRINPRTSSNESPDQRAACEWNKGGAALRPKNEAAQQLVSRSRMGVCARILDRISPSAGAVFDLSVWFVCPADQKP